MSENIEVTLYFAIYGYEMEISVGKSSHNLAIMMEVVELRYVYIEMEKELEFLPERIAF